MSRTTLFRTTALAVLALLLVGSALIADRSASADGGGRDRGGVKEVRLRDDCDAATFGSRLCTGNGGTTLQEFQAELAQRHTVGAWKIQPDESGLSIHPGESIIIVNRGGETHSFTKVAEFGGGRVQPLNDASNNPIPAPECLTAPNNTNNIFVAANSTAAGPTAGDATAPVGTTKFQCCIHPWMRSTVRVH